MDEQARLGAAAEVARRLIDDNRYLTLATADAEGRPWASPVWYAPVGYRDLLWLSEPHQRHSQNVAARSAVGIVIFDSTVAVGGAQAVYVEAEAEEVAGDAIEPAIAAYARRSLATGGRAWTRDDVVAPSRFRLYRARAREVSLLDHLADTAPGERRLVVPAALLEAPGPD